jgi:uncharacterized protein (DUF2236 family)
LVLKKIIAPVNKIINHIKMVMPKIGDGIWLSKMLKKKITNRLMSI